MQYQDHLCLWFHPEEFSLPIAFVANFPKTSFFGRKDHHHTTAFEAGLLVNLGNIRQLRFDSVHYFLADFRESNFPAPKNHTNLYLIVLC